MKGDAFYTKCIKTNNFSGLFVNKIYLCEKIDDTHFHVCVHSLPTRLYFRDEISFNEYFNYKQEIRAEKLKKLNNIQFIENIISKK